ncbi:MAG: 3-ketoacyl-ACP reductase [Pseudonocardia sp. SCN 72-86]|nr:MAG: 3-ketoacyl-ACP reductase [Pseudonocardia sp. SCN 72-86]
MGSLKGKVALVSGAARGQGRAHAVRLAQEGADIIAFDRCAPLATIPYDLASEADLEATAKAVEALGRGIVTRILDVRDTAGLEGLVADGVQALGRLDIVVANAGILAPSAFLDTTDEIWDEIIGVNLTGVFRTVRAGLPAILDGGRGGSIVLTSSTAGVKGMANVAPYAASKHAVIGLTKVLANEFGPRWIRANAVLPTSVGTDMILNRTTFSLMSGGRPDATQDDSIAGFQSRNVLPVPWIDADDVSNAVAWLCSDQARYVTGATLAVDAGATQK